MMLCSCFTMAISDPSGKSQPVPDSVRKVLLPATVTADVVTAPAQVAVIGAVVGVVYASSKISKATAPKAPVVETPEAGSE